ncbi:PREDICTED: uncharacterized protein LOC106784818 [Polistes canadensis]|uniref:uncharacterized protein LOC106784818 n=1 Tax=Polistes canadensis TaxID=91411 RepID=UPI000718AE71|nr:PREDICTED: uncharacterized protein LOC106784818 [Polistes canadensis]
MSHNNHFDEKKNEFLGVKCMEKYLRLIADEEFFTNISFSVTPAVKSGENFVGDVYRATIQGDEKNGRSKKIHLIAKCAPLDSRRKYIKVRRMFLQEIHFYEKLLPTFNDFLRDYNMTLEYIPYIYASSKEHLNEILVLEDLKYQNYYMRELKFLDYPHARLTLRCIARFHAYSFAIRAKKPETFEIFKSIKEPVFYFGNPITINTEDDDYSIALIDLIEKVLEEEDEHYRKRYKNFVKNMSKIALEVVKGSYAEPYAVVNHGDAWTNNILFKYKENDKNNEPEDLRFLDFQVCRYASPALDISYILFCFTLHEMRVKHYDDLLRDYYDSFSNCLRSLDCDPNVLFPYETLLKHIKHFGRYAACMAVYVLHFHADPNNRSLTGDVNVYHEILKTNKFYKNVLKNTFKEFIDRNII